MLSIVEDKFNKSGLKLWNEIRKGFNTTGTEYRKEVVKKTITNDGKETKKIQSKSTKVGRNDLCPCGSGKKYKNCCGK